MAKVKAESVVEACDDTPRSGRPRCEASRKAILDALWRLHRTTPLASLSIEAIAKEAGVGKTTIYRWWSSKAAIAMDAFLARYLPETGLPASGTPAERLRAQIESIVKIYRGPVGRLIADILAEGQSDPEALRLFREEFVARRRVAAIAVVKEGQARGDFDADLDPQLAMDLLYGPIYFRLLIQYCPLDANFARDLADRALKSLRVGSTRK